MKILDWFLFAVLAINIGYLLFFALAARFARPLPRLSPTNYRRLAVLIPAYKEDAVIEECVRSCLNQDYPSEQVTVTVISDHMLPETNERLRRLPITLVEADYENSTKSKALNLAMSRLPDHDIAIVFDADNTVDSDFFTRINEAFEHAGVRLLQAHRVAKNINNHMAVLDAVSEETNNSIFRSGHYTMGLSSALIGSGMAFDYPLFKAKMLTIVAVGGFDRNLELSFLKEGCRIHYLSDAKVYDEKVQNKQTFSNQRRRWLSAQVHYVAEFGKDFFPALMKGNIDFCVKYLQQLAIPRIILLGLTLLYTLLISLLVPAFAPKWWCLSGLLVVALLLAIPGELFDKRLLKALIMLPSVFWLMVKNLFKLKGANKQFIHTQHGINR
jgi:cellulose synthase/poly-beta-1,6-N-acetylglucosamine synthase-like glycosyltransferase